MTLEWYHRMRVTTACTFSVEQTVLEDKFFPLHPFFFSFILSSHHCHGQIKYRWKRLFYMIKVWCDLSSSSFRFMKTSQKTAWAAFANCTLANSKLSYQQSLGWRRRFEVCLKLDSIHIILQPFWLSVRKLCGYFTQISNDQVMYNRIN